MDDSGLSGNGHGGLSLDSVQSCRLFLGVILRKRAVIGGLALGSDEIGIVAERNHLAGLNFLDSTVLDNFRRRLDIVFGGLSSLRMLLC